MLNQLIDENYFTEIVERISKEFPEGMMFDYSGISFYVKYYSTCEDMFSTFAESNEIGLWLVCEYYDSDTKEFKEKYFTENFVRNRLRVLLNK